MSGSFGIMSIYLNYVKSGYAVVVNMLRTYSGEVLFTREHKATISKRKSNKKNFIDINKLQVFKDFINNK